MDFIDKISGLSTRIPKQLAYCETEEATKNALIMPFINALGYDVFNPSEVVPEYTADIGTKKGEKVDYAIFQNGKPIILVECKWSGADLSKVHASQLYRYFAALPEVRFSVLTNGLIYQFYTDLDNQNVMDEKPFFVFNILEFQERHVNELKKFTKSTFDLDNILTTASELKYANAIKQFITAQFEEPSEEFVIFLARQVYSGRITQTVKEQFSEITVKALKRFLNDRINKRLKTALEDTSLIDTPAETVPSSEEVMIDGTFEDDSDEAVVRRDIEKGIVTTEDEIEGFFIVKSILRDVIDHKRIHMRDTKTYCSVLLDDNNRKPICRLHFNRDQKYLGLFEVENGKKKESRITIDEIDNIYNYSDKILAVAQSYDSE
ncbi:MAG: type I restriction enzyme HsdR N-terminal domain-containing protein [Anaerolineales bacterium]|nr:type I restriction enzyme HsdR N-terminal domain-containing protein [Anaerolineales bacterium]